MATPSEAINSPLGCFPAASLLSPPFSPLDERLRDPGNLPRLVAPPTMSYDMSRDHLKPVSTPPTLGGVRSDRPPAPPSFTFDRHASLSVPTPGGMTMAYEENSEMLKQTLKNKDNEIKGMSMAYEARIEFLEDLLSKSVSVAVSSSVGSFTSSYSGLLSSAGRDDPSSSLVIPAVSMDRFQRHRNNTHIRHQPNFLAKRGDTLDAPALLLSPVKV